ncbi:MAG TPA: hypothetical protein VHN80_15215 [Kineosporiaceae bacterium]|nr:hypothetical protein [Kineosporiaceae bacterium]
MSSRQLPTPGPLLPVSERLRELLLERSYSVRPAAEYDRLLQQLS